MNNKKLVSIIIPVFNEEDSISVLVNETIAIIQKCTNPFEIIVVDDGSRDGTAESVRTLIGKTANLRLIRLSKNYGQTTALYAGFKNANGEYLITMDGDLQNDPSDIPSFIENLDHGNDLVVGWRSNRQDPFLTKKLPSRIANFLISKVTGVTINDTGCAMRGYKRQVVKNLPMYSDAHRLLPVFISLSGAKICEIEVNHRERKFGKSKYGLSRILKVLLDLIVIKSIISNNAKPLFGFGGLMSLFMLAGLVFLVAGIWIAMIKGFSLSVYAFSISLLWFFLGFFMLFIGNISDLAYMTGKPKLQNLVNVYHEQ